LATLLVGLAVLVVAISAVPILGGVAGLSIWGGIHLMRQLEFAFEGQYAARRAHERALRDLAEKPEFTEKKKRWGADALLTEIDGREVVVDWFRVSTGKSSTRVERIEMRCADLSRDIVLKREDFDSDLWRLVGGSDEVLGDSDFDQRVVVRGNRGEVTAKLNQETRAIIRELISAGIVLEGKKLTRIERGLYESVEEIEEIIELMRRAANALADTGEPEEQLLYNNVCSDSDPEVRARNLGMLFVDHSETEALRDALKAVLGESHGPGALDEAQEAAFMELLAAPERGKPEVPLDRQVAAAIVLGMGGSGSSVPFLRDWASPFPLEQHYAKRVAHLAVAAIQKRVGPVEGGTLSLSEVPMGAVSVAQGQGGELSIAEQEERRKKQAAALKGRQG
jgi:hypothetical protein